MRLSVLFWNVRGKSLPVRAARLAALLAPDIVVLTEAGRMRGGSFTGYADLNSRLLPPAFVVLRSTQAPCVEVIEASHSGRCMLAIDTPGGTELLLAAAHLRAKIAQSDDSQRAMAQEFARWITAAEDSRKHCRTVVVGDLNLDPYDAGVLCANGLHALPCSASVCRRRGTRAVEGDSRRLFYNPMWSLLGDCSAGPPGTIYNRGSSQYCESFWHMFDQFLLRHELLSHCNNLDVRIIDHDGVESLLTRQRLPDVAKCSDHLPIYLAIA